MKAAIAILFLLLPLMAIAGGTVTDSTSFVLQRSGKDQLPAPKTLAECVARKDAMVDAEKKKRVTGYITYKCLEIRQSYVKFSRTVTLPPPPPPPPANSATISWTPPTTNVDGSAAGTVLAGYRIYYGKTEPTQLWQVVDKISAGASVYVVDGLSPGKWYFVVVAYTSKGEESVRSKLTSKTIG